MKALDLICKKCGFNSTDDAGKKMYRFTLCEDCRNLVMEALAYWDDKPKDFSKIQEEGAHEQDQTHPLGGG